MLEKKITFNEILQRMEVESKEGVAKWKEEKSGGGDACCTTGDLTPEQKILKLIPKINEIVIEILSEEPYLRATMLVTADGSISIKQLAIIKSILEYTQRILHNTHFASQPRRTVTFKGEVKGLKVGEQMRMGDLVTMDVAVAKIPHVKQCCSSCQLWTLLVNQSSRECQLVPFK